MLTYAILPYSRIPVIIGTPEECKPLFNSPEYQALRDATMNNDDVAKKLLADWFEDHGATLTKHEPAHVDYLVATTAHYGQTFYHCTLRNVDGSAVRCRVNGKCKTWKRSPSQYSLPVKHGLRQCFYIDSHNGSNWLISDPTEKR